MNKKSHGFWSAPVALITNKRLTSRQQAHSDKVKARYRYRRWCDSEWIVQSTLSFCAFLLSSRINLARKYYHDKDFGVKY
jgi:hypothetical protein